MNSELYIQIPILSIVLSILCCMCAAYKNESDEDEEEIEDQQP